ncbi:predicted protein [Nematostella vectensis]|uniref:Protein downstream neighbor of son homolog n=1 Tax=Nematostella vectensis TaxID=45351 RepID=A7RRL7_NEMVE|nr:predicted protein [Nematostella vectensis]|eukprot:XP_001637914.1 predicted protein [Nematostella vectensis]
MSFEQQTTSSVPPDTDDIEETEEVAGSSNTIPLDWSLKTKVRFTSSQSFSWVSSLKSSELAEGISDFVRCEPKEFDDLDENMDFNQARTLLHKICRSWAHPFLPWLKLFPRSNNNEKALAEPRQTNTQSNVFVDESLASSLQADWVNSFHSVFNLLRCGNCPYFFMCANQCTMLFRAAGISSDDVDAVITPTTKGLREALKNEGIDFTLPHLSTPTHGEPSTSSSDSEDEATSDCDDEDDASDGGEWLESMGLGKEQFPTYEPNKLTTTQTAKIRTTDQNPASTVYVRGQDTRALFNFILNWRSIVPKNGQLAGVPPTLLAPVAFEGATLRSLKVNQGTVKHQQSKGLQQLFSLEITGPLMPSVVHDICCLIKSTQEGSYQAAFVPQQNSVAINFVSQPSVTGSRALASHKLGISETNCKYFSQEQTLNKASLKELTCKNGKFSWKQTS